MQKRPRVDRSDCRTIVKSDKKRPFGVGLTLNYQLATFDKFRRAGVKRVFLVDSENISDYSFVHNYSLNKEDVVVIFASDNSKSIKIQGLQSFIESEVKVLFEWITTGTQNELDFQLVAYLGMNVEENVNFYIVSDDIGFAGAIEYIKRKKDNVSIELIQPHNIVVSSEAEMCIATASLSYTLTKKSVEKQISESFNVVVSDKIRKSLKKVVQDSINANKDYEDIEAAMVKQLKKNNIRGLQQKEICEKILVLVGILIEQRKVGRMSSAIKIV